MKFRFDPFGRQLLTSQSGYNEPSGGYQVRRDTANTLFTLGVANLNRRTVENNDALSGQTASNSLDTKWEDQGYSFADGSSDSFNWYLFAQFGAGSDVSTLSAPVQPLSDKLQVNPLDVKPAPTTPLPTDPGTITQPKGQSESPLTTFNLGVTTLGIVNPQSPAGVLPNSISGIDPRDVKAPGFNTPGGTNSSSGQPSMPNVKDPGVVKAPEGLETLRPLGFEVNPLDSTALVPTSLGEGLILDYGAQTSNSGFYSTADIYSDQSGTSYTADLTSSSGDSGYYDSSADVSTVGAMAMNSGSLADQVNQDVLANVQQAFADRNLTYTADLSTPQLGSGDVQKGDLIAA